ncbi:MAG: hypothetical protein ACTSU5_15435 [Promethearchaeota archaeon]
MEPEELGIEEVFEIIKVEEDKRPTKMVKVQEEFASFFRAELYETIVRYIREKVDDGDDLADLKDDVLVFLEEVYQAITYLTTMVPIEEKEAKDSSFYQLVHFLQDKIFPFHPKLDVIVQRLRENTAEWYECQRYLLRPQTYYKESYEYGEVQGISPLLYKIINNITSLFNLDPNFGTLPGKDDIEVPLVKIEEVFEPFVDSVASRHKESVQKVVSQFGFQVLYNLFLAPTEQFLEIMSEFNYIVPRKQGEVTRWYPRFSNETLFLMYLGLAAHRRGFLSKELVNWISLNFSYIIYLGVTGKFVSEDNIFQGVIFEAKTLEKTIPYLMKLACFQEFLRIDRTKIRDSPQYRKEIYNFLGSHIPCIERLAQETKKMINEE